MRVEFLLLFAYWQILYYVDYHHQHDLSISFKPLQQTIGYCAGNWLLHNPSQNLNLKLRLGKYYKAQAYTILSLLSLPLTAQIHNLGTFKVRLSCKQKVKSQMKTKVR